MKVILGILVFVCLRTLTACSSEPIASDEELATYRKVHCAPEKVFEKDDIVKIIVSRERGQVISAIATSGDKYESGYAKQRLLKSQIEYFACDVFQSYEVITSNYTTLYLSLGQIERWTEK